MSSRPDKITGGCLCGAIRYTITIPPDMEWPPIYVSPISQRFAINLTKLEWNLSMYQMSQIYWLSQTRELYISCLSRQPKINRQS